MVFWRFLYLQTAFAFISNNKSYMFTCSRNVVNSTLTLLVHGPDRVTVHLAQHSLTPSFSAPLISPIFFKWPPANMRNHALGHNLSSGAAVATILCLMPMFVGLRNDL